MRCGLAVGHGGRHSALGPECSWAKPMVPAAAEAVSRGEKIVDWNVSLGTASKLASVVVHAQEYLEGLERLTPDENALAKNLEALKSVVYDRDVVEWIKRLGPLAPVKR